jgi:hypothetical protein
MKQVELGIAAKKHFLQSLIINGNYEEAIARALSLRANSEPALLSDMIFLALFCAGDKALFDSNRVYLSDAARDILDAYLSGAPLENGTPCTLSLISSYYSSIAFLSGRPKADAFLRLFAHRSRECFLVESNYNLENSLFREVMYSPYAAGVDPDEPVVREIMLTAQIRGGNLENALRRVTTLLEAYKIDERLLNRALALAQQTKNPRVAAEAQRLYDKYAYLYNEYIDRNDVLRTGFVHDDFRKRDRKRLADLTAQELENELNGDDKRTDHLLYLLTLEQAARIYEKKDVPAMALHCFERLFACGYKRKTMAENMARSFRKLGNKKLAALLLEMAPTLHDAQPAQTAAASAAGAPAPVETAPPRQAPDDPFGAYGAYEGGGE